MIFILKLLLSLKTLLTQSAESQFKIIFWSSIPRLFLLFRHFCFLLAFAFSQYMFVAASCRLSVTYKTHVFDMSSTWLWMLETFTSTASQWHQQYICYTQDCSSGGAFEGPNFLVTRKVLLLPAILVFSIKQKQNLASLTTFLAPKP